MTVKTADLRPAIKSAERKPKASKDTKLSREQIELSGEIVKLLPAEEAAALSKQFLGDDRHFHIAMFTDKKGASAFMNACLDRADELSARPAEAKSEPAAPAATARPVPKRFTPELIAKAAKLRESGMTWDKIGEQLDVRSTGLLSKRVREAAPPSAKPARKAAAPKATPTPSPRPRKATPAAPAGEQS